MSLLLLKQPWAVSWMWPLPRGDFLLAGVTLFMCLHLQAVCLGTVQLLLGWDVGGSRGRLLPWPPRFPRGCWFSRSAVAELHGKRDVIVGPAGKWWETEPLISRAWGLGLGGGTECRPLPFPPCQAIIPSPSAPAPGRLPAGAWAYPWFCHPASDHGDLPSMGTSSA